MTFLYNTIPVEEIAQGYRDFAKCLIKNNIGVQVTSVALEILKTGGVADRIAVTQSRNGLLRESREAALFLAYIHNLALHLAQRDIVARKAFVLIDFVGGFNMATAGLTEMGVEIERYLNKNNTHPKFASPPTITEFYPDAQKPQSRTIEVSFADYAKELGEGDHLITIGKALGERVSEFLRNSANLDRGIDFGSSRVLKTSVLFYNASEETLNHLKGNAERIGVSADNIRWAQPGI